MLGWREYELLLKGAQNPLSLWTKVSAIRENYPKTWRWILRSRRIQGWLSDAEGNLLLNLAHHYTPSCEAVVVEIGSWQGKSSVMLAAGLRGKRNSHLFCIDPFGQDEKPEYHEKFYASLMPRKKSIEDVFRMNVCRAGLNQIVTPIRGYSFEVRRDWRRTIDMLFLDANHEYDAILRDFDDWSPFLNPGAVVAFHDVIPQWPGVVRAVSERLVAPSYSPIRQIDSLAWATKIQ